MSQEKRKEPNPDNALSQSFQEQEKRAEEIKAEAVAEEANSRLRIYWAPASEYQLGNFKEEVRAQSGHIIQREDSIRFSGNIKTTDDSATIDYIEESDAFKAGIIKRAKDMNQANEWTIQHRAIKTGVREFREELVEKTVVG
jgi:predicted metal-dependent hydrolase